MAVAWWMTLFLVAASSVLCEDAWMVNPKRLLDSSKVVYALNCGAIEDLKSEHGFTYLADKYFTAGESSSYLNSEFVKDPYLKIKNTRDIGLHLNERLGTQGFVEYKLPVEYAGNYVLILLFAELNFHMVRQRSMRVLIGSHEVIPEFDIVRAAANFTQVPIYLPFTVLEDGTLLYNDQKNLPDGIVDTNKLHLTLERITDNPKIDGLILFKSRLDETNYKFINEVNREEMLSNGIIHTKEYLRARVQTADRTKQERLKKPIRIDRSVFFEDTEEWEDDIFNFHMRDYLKYIIALCAIIFLMYLAKQLNSRRSIYIVENETNEPKSPKPLEQPAEGKPKAKLDDKTFGLKQKSSKKKADS
jgi:Malectin domain